MDLDEQRSTIGNCRGSVADAICDVAVVTQKEDNKGRTF